MAAIMHQVPVQDLATADTAAFLGRVVPPGARVLDVGCGNGEVALVLARRGRSVKAIDSSAEAVAAAKAAGVDAETIDFLKYKGGNVDAVLFAHSLHHIHPLMDAIAVAAGLVKKGGLLVAEEFAVDRMDLATATWLYGSPDGALERWRAEHAHDPPLHGGSEMMIAIAQAFEITELTEAPYLYRYQPERRDEELAAIHDGQIRAIGLRFVARRL